MIKKGGMVRFDKEFIGKYGNIYGASKDAIQHIKNGNKPFLVNNIEFNEQKAIINIEEYFDGILEYATPIKSLIPINRKVRRLE